MPTKALHKVQKHVKRKGSNINALHGNSRDAKKLRRAGAREAKLSRLVTATVKANQVYVDRIGWFQSVVLEGANEEPCSDSNLQNLVSLYVQRNEKEIDTLKADRKSRYPGRPPSTREDSLSQQIDIEQKEFSSGLWTADIRDKEILARLRVWDGQWASLNKLTFVRVAMDGTLTGSSFPPKGLS